jgi:outer membrane protein assembly factor BamE (lipoprotein component of BamABCDE complex)
VRVLRSLAMIKLLLVFCVFLLVACSGAGYHKQAVSSEEGERMTVGTVQKEIRVGMSGGDVATVLGSPNIVSTDENRREVWIYDKISTQTAYSTDSGGIAALILGGWGDGSGTAGGAGSGSYQASSGAAARTQKTLTVIIKFDDKKRVRDFAYHTSTF